MMSCSKSSKDDKKMPKTLTISPKCLALILKESRRRDKSGGTGDGAKNGEPGEKLTKREADGYKIFQNFQTENSACYWNSSLVESATHCEYVGFMLPCIVLIKGSEYHLESLRNAWARRILKPPVNYTIKNVGDTNEVHAQLIPQAQFISLPEALCLVISKLNKRQENATLEIIRHKLQRLYSDMIVPSDKILYNALGNLIKERKIYHTGDGYFIMTPDSYHMNTTTIPASPERPILMTNEEAMQMLLQHTNESASPTHTSSKPIQSTSTHISSTLTSNAANAVDPDSKLERSQSLRGREDKEEENLIRSNSLKFNGERNVNLKSSSGFQSLDKNEKESLFSKLFRRGKRPPIPPTDKEFATFSAQFPPLDWNHSNSNSHIKMPIDHLKDSESSTSKVFSNDSKEKKSHQKSSDPHRHSSRERRSSKSPKSGNSPRKTNHSPLITSNDSSPRKGDSSPSNGSTKTGSSSPHGSDTPRKESFKESSIFVTSPNKLTVQSSKIRPMSMFQESVKDLEDQESDNFGYKEIYCTSFCSSDISKSYPPPHVLPNHNSENLTEENNFIGLLDSLHTNGDKCKEENYQSAKKNSSSLSKKHDHSHSLGLYNKVNGASNKCNSPLYKLHSKSLERDKNRESKKKVSKKHSLPGMRTTNGQTPLSPTFKPNDASPNGKVGDYFESKSRKETNCKNLPREGKISNSKGSVNKSLHSKTPKADSKIHSNADVLVKEDLKNETHTDQDCKRSSETAAPSVESAEPTL